MPESSTAPAPELTVPVMDLERRPGASEQATIKFEASEVIGTEVIGIAEGQPVELELLLESVLEGVLATGTVRSTALGECGRCLDRVSLPVEVTFQELFAYPERVERSRRSDRAAPDLGEDPDQLTVVDDTIDLTGPVRDAVALSLPFKALCREDCEGLCSECGVRLADEPGHDHGAVDPRWAVLEDILEDERNEI
ncbi:MAG: YceD family protein [Bifidobacteriaceae bacterium]|jgi:uncharacterized protein|nr:YceD family protein [Bifidobacteriaceae bacterium]